MASRETRAVPGAGTYDPKLHGNKSPTWVVGKAQRQGMANTAGKVPGPGNYETKTKVGEGPKYVMG